MTTLGDLSEPKVDQGGPGSNGEFLYVDISSVDNQVKRIVEPKRLAGTAAPSRARQRLRAGDVLVSMTRPNLNAVALVPPDLDGAIGSTGFHVLRGGERVLPRWLYYGVQTRKFVGAMSEVVQGALYPAIRPKDIRAFELPAPPLDEQHRIVAEIEKQFSRLDEAVANLKRVKANLKRYKAAVLKAAVEGRLVPTEAELARREARSYETGGDLLQRILEERRNERKRKGTNREPTPSDTTESLGLPDGWARATYAHIGEVTTGFTPPKADAQNFGGDVPFFKPTDLDAGYYVYAAREHLSDKGMAKGRKLPAGSVLVTCIGATIGKTGLSAVDCATNQQINAVSLAEGHGLPAFLYFWTVSPPGQRQILDNASATTLPILNKSKFAALAVPVPPLAEQHRIAYEIDRCLSLAANIDDSLRVSLRHAEALRASILTKALSASAAGGRPPSVLRSMDSDQVGVWAP